MQSGLYIVGTPIGNLGDFSARAKDTLLNADLVLCEDTRVSKKLFSAFDINTKLSVLADYNEDAAIPGIMEKIVRGDKIALISDSGMPGISDPGFRIIRACREAGLAVFVVPGPTAFTSALLLSGFPTDRFSFMGFFKGEKELAQDNRIRHTIIYYESPNRVKTTIGMMAKIMPERRIAIVREITKIFEETIIGYPADLIDIEPVKGEVVIVVEPAPLRKITDSEISEIVASVIGDGGQGTTKDMAAEIAYKTGISKKDAYNMVLKK